MGHTHAPWSSSPGDPSGGQGLGITNPAPLQGLRKNAVMRLIETGLAPREIQAITGQSLGIIEHDGQGFDRERLVESTEIKMFGKHTKK